MKLTSPVLHILIFSLALISGIPLFSQISPGDKLSALRSYDPAEIRFEGDWLISKPVLPSEVYRNDNNCLVLTNGLISRTFALQPNCATIGYENLSANVSLFRAVKPEATVTINGMKISVGGLEGQPVMNYFRDSWLGILQANPLSMSIVDFKFHEIKAPFGWKKIERWTPGDSSWPPAGIELVMYYQFDRTRMPQLRKAFGRQNAETFVNIQVEVHYEVYDGLPLLSKWITVQNNSKSNIRIDGFESELLAFAEPESVVGDKESWRSPLLSIETNYAFGGSMSQEASMGNSYRWMPDEDYVTVINYNRVQPTMLVVTPSIGPGVDLGPGEQFESYRAYELIHDNYDRERQGLAHRKMYRTLAPWITENPILMHVRHADDKSVRTAIDQCAEVGFEMVIMTFGSGFNIEDSSRGNWERMKMLGDYAHQKGIALGGYSLLASRSISPEEDVLLPEGQSPRFNNSPCLQSKWGQHYFKSLYAFYEFTGLDVLEHDGSYPGDLCFSERHPGHRDVQDSQWKQFGIISGFYQWCRGNGIYLNVPDWYFLNGSNKTGMGYRETNWSLPRAHQEIIERQNIYDGTWEKTPSMGWMFVPLVQYHGGGKEATIEPLKDHLDHYEQRLANLFGAGVQACYRGPRLFDAVETREVVKEWVDFYRKYRRILDSDIIHIRRPDGKDYDGILHVDPYGEEKGFLMLYNPLDTTIQKQIGINLYYTGLKDKAVIIHEDREMDEIPIPPSGKINLDVTIPANKWTWYVIK